MRDELPLFRLQRKHNFHNGISWEDSVCLKRRNDHKRRKGGGEEEGRGGQGGKGE